MGLFDFGRKRRDREEYLLRWQNVITKDSPDRLFMTEAQLRAATNQMANNDLRIINDCIKLVEKTTKPDVFFSRLSLLVEKAKHLLVLGKYTAFLGATPEEAYRDVVQNYDEAIRQFLIRYFSETFDKAEALKTEKGKIGKYQKWYDSLQVYYCYMNKDHIEYIETKYNAYTKK